MTPYERRLPLHLHHHGGPAKMHNVATGLCNKYREEADQAAARLREYEGLACRLEAARADLDLYRSREDANRVERTQALLDELIGQFIAMAQSDRDARISRQVI